MLINKFSFFVLIFAYTKIILKMNKHFILAVLLFFSSITVISAQNLQELYQKAKGFYDKQEYAQAIPNFDMVLQKDQSNVMSFFYRGVSHYHLKNYEQAIADLDNAIAMYSIRADFYYYRALARKEMKDIGMAYSDMSSAIAYNDKNADYYYERAKLGLQIGEANTMAAQAETVQTNMTNAFAIMDLDKAIALNPNLEAEAKTKRKETFSKLSTQELEILPLTATDKDSKPVPDDAKTIEVKNYIKEHKFESLQDGRSFYDKLYSETLPSGKRTVVLGLLKAKILQDIFGENPYADELEKMKQTLDREYWLAPEGREYYFKLAQNSKYVFSGGIQRGKAYYFYKVFKNQGAEKYRLQMYGVVNGESNLVFDSQIACKEDSTKRTIQVFASQNAGYKWDISKFDYMEAENNLQNNSLKFSPMGAVVATDDNKHGVSKDKYNKAIKPADKTSQAAIKATIHYVILDYVRMLYKPSWWKL